MGWECNQAAARPREQEAQSRATLSSRGSLKGSCLQSGWVQAWGCARRSLGAKKIELLRKFMSSFKILVLTL